MEIALPTYACAAFIYLLSGRILKTIKKPSSKAGSYFSNGEPDRIRTCDKLIKSQLLYQLSYGPLTSRRAEHRHLVHSGQAPK